MSFRKFCALVAVAMVCSTAVLGEVNVQIPDATGTLRNVPGVVTRFPDGSEVVQVSLEEISRVHNGTLAFDPLAQYATLSVGEKTARFLMGSQVFVLASRDGVTVTRELPVAPRMKDGKLLLTKAAALVFLEQFRALPSATAVAGTSQSGTGAGTAGSGTGGARRELPKIPAPRESHTATPTSYPEPAKVPAAQRVAPFIRNIVIDAGHGDHDAGAVGPGGTKEKDVNLAVAVELASKLSERVAGNVLLTRNGDTFLSLGERVSVAKRSSADLFISIHSNSVPKSASRSVSGTEVYFFSKPTDEHAALAEKLHGGPFDPKTVGIDPVLWNLMLAGNVIESHKLAETVQKTIPGRIGLPSRGVKSARFYVLYYGVLSNFPSILIEMGFISNPEEERKLSDPEWQKKTAAAISEAVVEYLRDLERRYPNGEGWTKS